MADRNPIHALCKKIMAVSDEHLTDLEDMAASQGEYISPLKLATQGRTNQAGAFNRRVLYLFRELRAVLQAGPAGTASTPIAREKE